MRGEEITSGAQRLHDYAMLIKRAEECNIRMNNLNNFYLFNDVKQCSMILPILSY